MDYKLYKTNIDIQKFLSEAISESGEIINENSLALYESSLEKRDELLINLAIEAKNINNYIKNMEAERDNLAERILKTSNRIQLIERILASELTENLITPQVEVKFRKSSYVELDEISIEEIDKKYIKTEIKKTISKERIENDLKAGVNLPYARIMERKNIKIK